MILDLTVPGRALATAWETAWLSTGKDAGRPPLDHTVLLETFDMGDHTAVQLVATDSYSLTGSVFADERGDDFAALPALEVEPDTRHLIRDPEGRMATVMKWVMKECKAAAKEDAPEPTVRLRIRSAEADHQPTLDPSLDRSALVVSTSTEQITLEVLDGDQFPTWRHLIPTGNRAPEATDALVLSPMLLARMGKLPGIVKLTFHGRLGPVGIEGEVGEGQPIFGLVMPIRRATDEASPAPDGDDDLTITLSTVDENGEARALARVADQLGGDAA